MVELILPLDGFECDIELDTVKRNDKSMPAIIRIKSRAFKTQLATNLFYIQSTSADGTLKDRRVCRQARSSGRLLFFDRMPAAVEALSSTKEKEEAE